MGAEDHDAGDQEALTPEAQREPAAGRRDDRIGDKIAGEDPRRLVSCSREAPRNVRQRHTGDRRVDHFHKRGQHHGNRQY